VGEQPQDREISEALAWLAQHCPRLSRSCYWAGPASISLEELHHRRSFDLDFHTRKAMADTRPILAEMQNALGRRFELIQPPDEHGSGFRGLMTLPSGAKLAIEVLSNFQNVRAADLVASSTTPGMARVTLRRYLEDKVQCVVERAEGRDLVDLWAALARRPAIERALKAAVARQDALLLSERLLSWDAASLSADLAAYDDVDPADALRMRDLLLTWLKGAARP